MAPRATFYNAPNTSRGFMVEIGIEPISGKMFFFRGSLWGSCIQMPPIMPLKEVGVNWQTRASLSAKKPLSI